MFIDLKIPEIDENFSYLLGFLSTDGYVDKRGLSIEISIKDIQIIKDLENYFFKLGWSPKIDYKKMKDREYIRIRIHSTKISKFLIENGIWQNKSLNIPWTRIIQNNNIKHYIRGILDGDGCIFERRNDIQVIICSASYDFINGLMDSIKNNLEISKKNLQIREKKNKLYILNYYSNEAKKILDWIYEKPVELKLNRKYLIWKNYKKIRSNMYWTTEQDKILIENINNNLEEISKKTNKSIDAVRTRIWRIKSGRINI